MGGQRTADEETEDCVLGGRRGDRSKERGDKGPKRSNGGSTLGRAKLTDGDSLLQEIRFGHRCGKLPFVVFDGIRGRPMNMRIEAWSAAVVVTRLIGRGSNGPWIGRRRLFSLIWNIQ